MANGILKTVICFTLLLIPVWALLPIGEHVCMTNESFTTMVRVEEPYQYRRRRTEWCFKIPPRCSKYDTVWNWRWVDKQINETRTVPKCCMGYVAGPQDDDCRPFCSNPCKHGVCLAPDDCSCEAGYKGRLCETACPRGSWGIDCSQTCECRNGAFCDPVSGDCQCAIGWLGPRCDQPCKEGYYGDDCKNQCSCGEFPCHHITGDCLFPTTITTEISTTPFSHSSQPSSSDVIEFSRSTLTLDSTTPALGLHSTQSKSYSVNSLKTKAANYYTSTFSPARSTYSTTPIGAKEAIQASTKSFTSSRLPSSLPPTFGASTSAPTVFTKLLTSSLSTTSLPSNFWISDYITPSVFTSSLPSTSPPTRRWFPTTNPTVSSKLYSSTFPSTSQPTWVSITAPTREPKRFSTTPMLLGKSVAPTAKNVFSFVRSSSAPTAPPAFLTSTDPSEIFTKSTLPSTTTNFIFTTGTSETPAVTEKKSSLEISTVAIESPVPMTTESITGLPEVTKSPTEYLSSTAWAIFTGATETSNSTDEILSTTVGPEEERRGHHELAGLAITIVLSVIGAIAFLIAAAGVLLSRHRKQVLSQAQVASTDIGIHKFYGDDNMFPVKALFNNPTYGCEEELEHHVQEKPILRTFTPTQDNFDAELREILEAHYDHPPSIIGNLSVSVEHLYDEISATYDDDRTGITAFRTFS